jgi:hypothetical protein
MRNFFRSLEKEGVRYLLISGQACVLYGASHFTEDIDLWVRPSEPDLRALLRVLGSMGARVHKLTPPINRRTMLRGHGFHFRLLPDTYLDVMGRPPRVGPFSNAQARARRLATDWGPIPVAAPEDLVLLKRTNRPSDYETISNLVKRRVEEAPEDLDVLRWALRNTYSADDLASFALSAAGRMTTWPRRPPLQALLPISEKRQTVPYSRRRETARLLALEAFDHQERGRRYWIPLIRELKDLRRRGKLIPPGTPVSSLPR